MLTIDDQMPGRRERDLRDGFTIPPRPGPREPAGMATKLPWPLRMRRELPRNAFANYVPPGEAADLASLAGRMGGTLDPGLAWGDVDSLRRIWDMPSLPKGVLHPRKPRPPSRPGSRMRSTSIAARSTVSWG